MIIELNEPEFVINNNLILSSFLHYCRELIVLDYIIMLNNVNLNINKS
jgi:hypothetical protein